MCGIFGYKCDGGYDPRIQSAVPILALHMRERGKHSWGITDGTDVKKFKGDISDTFENQFLSSPQLLGHTRFGTTGALTAENSHPFHIGDILGVHNGVVYNHEEIAKKYEIKYDVDSEVIYHRMAERGDLSEINAYGALVFFQDGIIHLGKFNGGSLELARCEWGWIWASTQKAVSEALQFSGLKSTGKFWVKMKEGKLYKLIGDQVVKDERRLSFGKRVSTSAVTTTTGYGTGYSQWRGHGNSGWDDDYDDKRSAHSYHYAQGRIYQSGESCYYDPKDGKWYERYLDTTPIERPKPLPTAQTTTFTAEPSSDDDDVVDTNDTDNPNEDPVAEYEDSEPLGCSMCHKSLQNKEYVCIKNDRLCSTCYKEWMGMSDADDTPAAEPRYKFKKMDADEIFDEFRSTTLMQCEDCGELPFGDEKMYVEREREFALCAGCYDTQYASVSEVEEEVEEAKDESASEGETCGPVTTPSRQLIGICMRPKGHAGTCVDAHGVVLKSPLPDRTLIPAA